MIEVLGKDREQTDCTSQMARAGSALVTPLDMYFDTGLNIFASRLSFLGGTVPVLYQRVHAGHPWYRDGLCPIDCGTGSLTIILQVRLYFQRGARCMTTVWRGATHVHLPDSGWYKRKFGDLPVKKIRRRGKLPCALQFRIDIRFDQILRGSV